MHTTPGQPDPSLYIDRLADEDAFHREAAAWTLGEIGSPRAARPLAGLLLRELTSVERSGFVDHNEVVCAATEAMRRIGATEGLYALVKGLCVLSHAQGVDETTIVEIVDTIGELGGPTAMREATDRVVRDAGKPVYAYSSFLTDAGLLVGSACDSILVFPKGTIALLGPGATIPHLKGALEKLDVKDQLHRIAEYKSASELFAAKESSKETIENLTWLLEDLLAMRDSTLSSRRRSAGVPPSAPRPPASVRRRRSPSSPVRVVFRASPRPDRHLASASSPARRPSPTRRSAPTRSASR